jgi:hypothetical protein
MLRLAIIGFLVAGSAAAEPVSLTKTGIQDTLAGATLEIDAPMGNKLPITYGTDGKMAGKAGGLSWFLGSSADTGRWWVANDKLCNAWSKWFEAKTQCLKLKLDGERIAWSRDDGETGTATIVARAPKAHPPSPVLASAGSSVAPRILNAAPGSAQIASLGGPMPAQLPMEEIAKPPASATAATEAVVPRRKIEAKKPPSAQPSNAQRPTVTPKAQPPPSEVEARTPPAAQSPAPAQPTSSRFGPSLKVAGVADNDVLQVRRGPAEHFPPVGAIPPQAQGVILLGQCRYEWCPVQHGAVRGWAHSYYLAADTRR